MAQKQKGVADAMIEAVMDICCAFEFIPLSLWYDAPLTSRYSARRHHPWPVYGALTCRPVQ